MAFEDRSEFASQVADLNKYGQALNNCETVEEVVSLTLEATQLLFAFPHTTFVEVHEGDGRVVHSTDPEQSQGDDPGDVAIEALETQETVVRTGTDAEGGVGSALAVPATIVDDVVAIIVARSPDESGFGEEVVRPLEILASHAATAIGNIRSRERLERARQDLAKRKEMVEMYDRLLRHDLGNDLQVVAAFAEKLAMDLDGQEQDYAERIERTAMSAADLIQRVGDLVNTLEQQDEPSEQSLSAILTEVVEDATDGYESLTVEYDPATFDYQVYGGDLLDSVFTNVVTNAAVHNDGPVTVRLDATATEETVSVTVADDGSGIPEGVVDDLFEMGAKGPDSSGTGFGLGFVKALTESYGGDVSVGESEMGGAAFVVTLDRV